MVVALLGSANSGTCGHPVPAPVRIATVAGKAILVSADMLPSWVPTRPSLEGRVHKQPSNDAGWCCWGHGWEWDEDDPLFFFNCLRFLGRLPLVVPLLPSLPVGTLPMLSAAVADCLF